MNAFVAPAHTERRSFDGAMFDAAVGTLPEAGRAVVTSDLYRMGFDPVSIRRNFTSVRDADSVKLQREEPQATEAGGFAPEIEEEIVKAESADLMIWQFPLWWFALPAVLKGGVDRAFVMGRSYGGGHVDETGRFSGKRAPLSVTAGGPEAAYRPDGFNGDLSAILRPIRRGTPNFTGFAVLRPQVVHGPAHVDDTQRATWLAERDGWLARIQNESPIDVGRY